MVFLGQQCQVIAPNGSRCILPSVPAASAPSDSQLSCWALPMWLTQILPRMVLTWGRNHFNSPMFPCNQQRIMIQLSCRFIANIISKLRLCAAHLSWPLIFLVCSCSSKGLSPSVWGYCLQSWIYAPLPPTTHTYASYSSLLYKPIWKNHASILAFTVSSYPSRLFNPLVLQSTWDPAFPWLFPSS